ncbi:hypothetical protein [Salinisphaera aquimarina]|uniref:Uncharacterized protein n=1 Tax=Salinisphaera aquimarina TaxID=2094031 RepID=A0ABV7ESU9_9GAMM
MATHLVHPAAQRLYDATLAQRRQLARALAIEYDWRHHDGPEWAARYWAAFGDLQSGVGAGNDAVVAARVAARAQWPLLDADESAQLRHIFRALLNALHPELRPRAAADARALLWPEVLRAYRGGDSQALRGLLARTRALEVMAELPPALAALRGEHDRLVRAREAADRRLAELSQTFPFCMRDKLADAEWIRRQRLALRQIRVMTATPRPLPALREDHRKQVS